LAPFLQNSATNSSSQLLFSPAPFELFGRNFSHLATLAAAQPPTPHFPFSPPSRPSHPSIPSSPPTDCSISQILKDDYRLSLTVLRDNYYLVCHIAIEGSLQWPRQVSSLACIGFLHELYCLIQHIPVNMFCLLGGLTPVQPQTTASWSWTFLGWCWVLCWFPLSLPWTSSWGRPPGSQPQQLGGPPLGGVLQAPSPSS
jgi:hypothetical protein